MSKEQELNQLAKSKAFNLHFAFYNKVCADFEKARQAGLIAVDELIKEQNMWQNGQPEPVLFWQQVKVELLNLKP